VIIFLLSANKTGEPGAEGSKKPIYLNTAYSFEERAADLVSRLTPEEKQSLVGNNMAAIPRLGINAFNVWSEALHGVMGRGAIGAGSFPNIIPQQCCARVFMGSSLMERKRKLFQRSRGN
jgi:hypothetical protein